MKSKLIALNYQRNGVAGTPFYHALIENLSDTKGKFLCTFEERNDEINYESCRVVALECYEFYKRKHIEEKFPFYKSWRGDHISSEIAALLNAEKERLNVKSWFDVSQVFHNTTFNTEIYLVEYNEAAPVETYSETINSL